MRDFGHGPAHERLGAALVNKKRRGETATITWVNHCSAQRLLPDSDQSLTRFDYLGIDGKFLQRLTGSPYRTSADLVIPVILECLGPCRLAIIGGSYEDLPHATQALQQLAEVGSEVVFRCDGYTGLVRGIELAEALAEVRPDVVIIGLGVGLQEKVALEAAERLKGCLILTCGGFLDQIQIPNYYPWWAYPTRTNWLIRLIREPRRLHRRYTVDAVRAVLARPRLKRGLSNLTAFAAANELMIRPASHLVG